MDDKLKNTAETVSKEFYFCHMNTETLQWCEIRLESREGKLSDVELEKDKFPNPFKSISYAIENDSILLTPLKTKNVVVSYVELENNKSKNKIIMKKRKKYEIKLGQIFYVNKKYVCCVEDETIFNKEKLESMFRKNIEENLKYENSLNSESMRTRSKSKDPNDLGIKEVKELVANDELFSCKKNIFSGQGKNDDDQEPKGETEKKVEIIDNEKLNKPVLKKRKEISLADQTCSSSTTTGTKIEHKLSCTNKIIYKNPKISADNNTAAAGKKKIENLIVKFFVVSGFRLLPEKIKKLEGVGLYLRMNDDYHYFNYLILKSFGWTKKFMVAILKGKDILQIDYLDECLKHKKILPIENYTFKDEKAEGKYQFRLTDTIEKVRKQEFGVFDKKEFFVWENLELLNDVSEIIKAGGGIISEIILIDTSQIILIKNSDKQNFENVLGKVKNIYSFELVFMACIQQKIDFEQFKLY